jgi:hypothetical protein
MRSLSATIIIPQGVVSPLQRLVREIGGALRRAERTHRRGGRRGLAGKPAGTSQGEDEKKRPAYAGLTRQTRLSDYFRWLLINFVISNIET